MKPFFSHEYPIAMAHRGSRLLWPENTMTAFQGAVDLGFRYLETDLHTTADGILVCFHDDTLERTTDATGLITDRTFAEVQRLDAGFRHEPLKGFPFRGRGVTVPALEDVLTAFPHALFTLDLKQSGIEHIVVEMINRLRLHDRVIVGSFKDLRIARFRKMAGRSVATSAGPWETRALWAGARLGRSLRIPADALQVPVSYGRTTVVDARFVHAAHEAGKQVHVWTVNEPDEMRYLLDLGVDALISDRVDIVHQVMRDHLQ
ncbi:MAG: glycerophosphodiester phosphodiesterase [Acidimicrobiia bacterium]|nr:glycerophosphodiester phosphodiesterase [Acidimicrobiia bacterium]